MCGRYVLAESPARLAKRFDVQKPPDLLFDGQRFNIAPSQQVPMLLTLPETFSEVEKEFPKMR
jgi:putative SOS response-associated peptidase YedK